jgi:hypothetical protein
MGDRHNISISYEFFLFFLFFFYKILLPHVAQVATQTHGSVRARLGPHQEAEANPTATVGARRWTRRHADGHLDVLAALCRVADRGASPHQADWAVQALCRSPIHGPLDADGCLPAAAKWLQAGRCHPRLGEFILPAPDLVLFFRSHSSLLSLTPLTQHIHCHHATVMYLPHTACVHSCRLASRRRHS